jgi:hypothetical protein
LRYTTRSGNFPLIAQVVLKKIKAGEEARLSYQYNKHMFHYVVQDGITYLAMTEGGSGERRLASAFFYY